MAINSAKALWAKLLSDPDLKAEFAKLSSQKAFEELAAKHGYACTLEEFQAAKDSCVEGSVISDEALGQVSGGLSLVGVDYAFTAVEATN